MVAEGADHNRRQCQDRVEFDEASHDDSESEMLPSQALDGIP
jgi:hypothetical protein